MDYKTCYTTPVYYLSNFINKKELQKYFEICLMNTLIQLQSNERIFENIQINSTDTTISANINMKTKILI
jgi:hypothetical protein